MNVFERFRQMELFAAAFEKEAIPSQNAKKSASVRAQKRAENRRRTVRMTVSALVSALSAVVLFLGVSLGVLDMTALAIASFGVVFCILEMGGAYPYLVWLATSALCLLLLPDKLVAFEYFLFAGIYPVVKFRAAKLNVAVGWVIKLAAFNFSLTACALISMFVLGLDADAGLSLGWVIYGAGNVFFVLFDLALSSVSAFYILRLRHAVRADSL